MAALGKVTHIVIHYTATAPGDDVTVETIRGWHLARGFRDIGYHYVVYRDGSIHKGRDENVRGAHVKNQNRGKIGISWVGGVTAANRDKGVNNKTQAQERALISLIDELLERHPGAQVVGHRDLASTQCPGQDIIPWWASVKAGVPPPPDIPAVEAPVRTPPEGMGEDANRPATEGVVAVAGIIALLSDITWWVGATVIVGAALFGLWRFGFFGWAWKKVRGK